MTLSRRSSLCALVVASAMGPSLTACHEREPPTVSTPAEVSPAARLALEDTPPEEEAPALLVLAEAGARITAQTSEADLKRALGASRVARLKVPLGEGVFRPGTVLFATDPARRLEILWRDDARRDAPARLRLSGKESAWRLPGGLTLGFSLEALKTENGRPFTLSGFAWDGAGVVASFEGGELERLLDEHRALIRLCPAEGKASAKAFEGLVGQATVPSEDPRLRQLSPFVCEIVLRPR